MRGAADKLIAGLKAAHATSPAMREFSAFPEDLTEAEVTSFQPDCADYFARSKLNSTGFAPLLSAIRGFAPHAKWRETYKGTDIGDDFLSRFGCYAIIGEVGAPFRSQNLWAWMVHMPPRLHYPWHEHPAEELYLVLSGQARFMREGDAPEVLGEGGSSFHASNQPHAMETGDASVLCLVLWRNGFDGAPVLTRRAING